MESEQTQLKSKTGICIVTASNNSHSNAAILGSNPDYSVNILTRRPEIFGKEIIGDHSAGNKTFVGKLNTVSSDPSIALKGCKYIVISCPG